MKRYVLTPEQAHGLLNAAGRSLYNWEINQREIDRAEYIGRPIAYVQDGAKSYIEMYLRVNQSQDRPDIIYVFSGKARLYLEANGIKEEWQKED